MIGLYMLSPLIGYQGGTSQHCRESFILNWIYGYPWLCIYRWGDAGWLLRTFTLLGPLAVVSASFIVCRGRFASSDELTEWVKMVVSLDVPRFDSSWALHLEESTGVIEEVRAAEGFRVPRPVLLGYVHWIADAGSRECVLKLQDLVEVFPAPLTSVQRRTVDNIRTKGSYHFNIINIYFCASPAYNESPELIRVIDQPPQMGSQRRQGSK
ncbi:hypothetical protein EDD22DRAFT_848480 [Suillus occidentalis]|nr:hypothetical protein EDD22DRAFT_848480 [Suillus occidentalis]